MERNRAEVMEKARAKRLRREEIKAARKATPPAASTAAVITEKVVDLAHGAAAQVGEIVKAAAGKVAGSGG